MYAIDFYYVDMRAPAYGFPSFSTLTDAEEQASLYLRCMSYLRCVTISDHKGVIVRTINRP